MPIRESLLLSQRSAQAKEAELYPLVGDSLGEGEWGVKDHLAHLVAWREWASDALRGEFVSLGEVDDFNAKVYEATKDQAAAEVLSRSHKSWERLIGEIENLTEEELHRDIPDRPGRELWSVVPGNAHLHLAEHLAFIAEARGDQAAADAAQVWARDLVVETFDDPSSMAHAEYNLGCYYAKGGRAGLALPYLERALALEPSLRDLAGRDPDFDPIRGEAAFVEVLAG
ncbi:MAG TPA: DinB family protein [Candidatus Dormibacteraeota bacterium]